MLDSKNPLRIGLGLAALGRPGYINLGHDEDLGADKSIEGLQAHAWRVLDAAWGAGIRYFDAARSYGRAEAFLAGWLETRAIPRQEIFVASKWGYRYTADWQVDAEAHEIKEHSLAHLQFQFKESQALLGEQLNLYQIHSATLDSGVLDNKPVLDELARLKAGGLGIGLSLSGPHQSDTLLRALEIQRDGGLLFSAVQATWNLLEPAAGEALQSAHAAGLRVIVKETLANGRLTQRNQEEDFQAKKDKLGVMARRKGVGIDALAIATVLAQPWVDVVLSGAAREDHLGSNLEAADIKLNQDEIAEVLGLQEQPKEYWQKRSRLNWN